MRSKFWAFLAGVVGGGLLLATVALAQPLTHDPANYAALASADSSDTIAPDTKITLQNWQNYKTFLPIGVQAMFSQKY